MRLLYTLLLLCSVSLVAQVSPPSTPNRPGTNNTRITGPSWTKQGIYYTLKDASGNVLSNTVDLKYLKTDTLGVLDKTNRNVYLLADFKNAAEGSTGKAILLQQNVGNSFYFTNPYSFVHYVDDEYNSGPFSNINGDYIYYQPELGATYRLPNIRSHSTFAAQNSIKLPASSNHTYWYRDATKGEYGIIKEGRPIDYSVATPKKVGNDMTVDINGVHTYTLPGYYTMASFVYTPVTMANNSVSGSGCVSGDCQNGWGKWEDDNGYYDGFWKNGKKDGYGMYKWTGIGKYIGNWSNGNMTGYGVYLADNKDNVVGEYLNGELNGKGYTVTGDTCEQGVYSNGQLVTSHTFVTNNVTTGCTAGDCVNKYGRYKWDNGDSFTGFWLNGRMYMGTYAFASGDKYSGMFNSNNEFDGMGRFFFESGEYYGGYWKNGKYEGRGYYHDQDYKQQIGVWSNGSLVTSMK